jgi:uncharacterized membrane protein
MAILLSVALSCLAAALVRTVRRERLLSAEVAELTERVNELAVRMEATEHDVARAATQAEIAESVLLEKGVADEEDLEAVRQRFDPVASEYVRDRDGDLN